MLVDNGKSSHVQRLHNLDKSEQFDLFICQLSINDATKHKSLVEISESKNLEDFDTSAITGAMDYIICYAQETWDCPVVFFTGSRYNSEAYGVMVACLLELHGKWGIGVFDLWSSDAFNDISDEQRAIYTNDGIHPTRAGYQNGTCSIHGGGYGDLQDADILIIGAGKNFLRRITWKN